MRSDAFDQQRELRMKEGWREGERGEGGCMGREGFGDESCAEDGHDNDADWWWWWWWEEM